MMNRRWNGSFKSVNTPSWNSTGILREDYNLFRCMIVKVIFADDPNNLSKNATNPETLYDVVILGGKESGQIISNCRMAPWLGGGFSGFYERTLKSTSKDISTIRLSDHDGDIVYVEFIQGNDAYPIIKAMGKSLKDSVSGTPKAKAPREVSQYNGIYEEKDNQGNYTFIQKGGTTDKTYGWTPGNSEIYKKLVSAVNESITETFKSGLQIVKDGQNDQVSIKTKAGVQITVNGKSNNVSIKAGTTEVLIDGASGKISLKGNFVDLGASVSDFVTKFTELASAFASHTHMYTDNGTPMVTQPPMAPLLTSVGSSTVKVQA